MRGIARWRRCFPRRLVDFGVDARNHASRRAQHQSFVFDFLFFRSLREPSLLVRWSPGSTAGATARRGQGRRLGARRARANPDINKLSRRGARGHLATARARLADARTRAALPGAPRRRVAGAPRRRAGRHDARRSAAEARSRRRGARRTLQPMFARATKGFATTRRRRRRPSISTPTTGSPRRSRPSRTSARSSPRTSPTRGTPTTTGPCRRVGGDEAALARMGALAAIEHAFTKSTSPARAPWPTARTSSRRDGVDHLAVPSRLCLVWFRTDGPA